MDEAVGRGAPDGYRNRPVSWVRRGVRMTEGQAAAWDRHGSKYLVDPPRGAARESIQAGWRLLPGEIFHNDDDGAALDSAAPLVVEIGTGRGENIVAAAAHDPARNYLGVEVYGPGLARAILNAEAAGGLPNLRLIQADAPELLDALPAGSVSEAWVFFPDPWPKTRHQKRRLVSAEFVAQLAEALAPGGVARLATDWPEYATQFREVFAASSSFQPLAEPGEAAERFAGRVVTAFEAKAGREGRGVQDFAYRRV